MAGKLAIEFGDLIQGLEASQTRDVAPRDFKRTVGKFEPRFAGYQQQDAFEFVSRVLECLGHELNRVLVQEYQELPDSAGKPDAEVARDHWENTVARENNIITALFTGQQCSRLVCTQSNVASVAFEQFIILQVPLPEVTVQTVDVIVKYAAPLVRTQQRPIWPLHCKLTLGKSAKKGLRLWGSRGIGLPPLSDRSPL